MALKITQVKGTVGARHYQKESLALSAPTILRCAAGLTWCVTWSTLKK